MTVIEGGKANGVREGVAAKPVTPEGLKVRRCSLRTCSGRDAVAVVVLLLRPAGHRGPPMRMRIGVCVCEACKSPLPDKFLTNAEWSRLLEEQFDRRKIARPSRILTEVDYVPIGDDPDLDGLE